MATDANTLKTKETEQDRQLNKAYIRTGIGDVSPIFDFFKQITDIEHSDYSELYQRYQTRFITQDEATAIEDKYIKKLYLCYRKYWTNSLLKPQERESFEKNLFSDLKSLIDEVKPNTIKNPNNNDSILSEISDITKEKGYYLLLGKTPPLQELMLWKKQEQIIFPIELPEETLNVKIEFLSDFITKGWYGFATFDKKYTGGWATDKNIYKVGAPPKEMTESFEVSLLAHEGRHISDKTKYHLEDSAILEYRAKLTELLLAEETFNKLICLFKDQENNNPSAPHPYASYLIFRDLEEKLGKSLNPKENTHMTQKEIQEVKNAIRELLTESTDKLIKASKHQ